MVVVVTVPGTGESFSLSRPFGLGDQLNVGPDSRSLEHSKTSKPPSEQSPHGQSAYDDAYYCYYIEYCERLKVFSRANGRLFNGDVKIHDVIFE